MAGGLASFSPVEMIRSVAGTATTIAGAGVGGILSFFSETASKISKALIQYAGELTDIGIQAAAGALSAVKSALPVAIERERSLRELQFSGLERLTRGGRGVISRADATNLSQALLPVIGRIDPSDAMAKQIDRLFVANNQNQIVRRDMATALAQGDFSALGTDRGYFLNQIAQSINNLPPSMAKTLRAQLIAAVGEGELDRESARLRQFQVGMEASDLNNQQRIADIGARIQKDLFLTNTKLNRVLENMVRSASSLNGILDKAATATTKLLQTLQPTIESAKRRANL